MIGAFGYVMSDKEFLLSGFSAYFWVALYFFLLCFSMIYGKVLSNTVKMSVWGQALYSNLLSIPVTIFFGLAAREDVIFPHVKFTIDASIVLTVL